jgi:hypothetical protein
VTLRYLSFRYQGLDLLVIIAIKVLKLQGVFRIDDVGKHLSERASARAHRPFACRLNRAVKALKRGLREA